jgi:RHS repeat-associated protein
MLGDGSLACRTNDAGDRLETLLHYAGGTCETPSSRAVRGFGYAYDGLGDRVLLQDTWDDGSLFLRFEAQFAVAAAGSSSRPTPTRRARGRTRAATARASGACPVPDVPPAHYLTALAPSARPPPLRRLRPAARHRRPARRWGERASYDLAGRTRAADAGGSRTWGPDSTLTDAGAAAGSLGSYTYDADGLRRRKLSPAADEGERLSVYDGGALVAELDAGTLAPRLLYLSAGEVLGVVDYASADPDGHVEWLHRDGMRSIVERTALDSVSGEARRVAGPFRYDAWGTLRDVSAPMPADGSTHLAYTGHVLDPETGLVYAKARYLVPELGRFLSDPYEGSLTTPSLHRSVCA